jgi:hypothetical protein
MREEQIDTCTRQSPHICRVNGPCNGWPKPEGLNPPIHCQLSRGIANPVEKPLDFKPESAVE